MKKIIIKNGLVCCGLMILVLTNTFGQQDGEEPNDQKKVNENRLFMTTLLYFADDGKERVTDFQEKAGELFEKYDRRIEYAFNITQKAQVGEKQNPIAQPDVIQIISFPSMEVYQSYIKDSVYIELSGDRDQGLRKFNFSFGSAVAIDDLKAPCAAPAENRMYGVSFINFKENGEKGIMKFMRKGIETGLYKKYGIHVDFILKPEMNKFPLDKIDFESPEMILIFYLDDKEKLYDYIEDPVYKEIASIRDDGLKSYYLFLGEALE